MQLAVPAALGMRLEAEPGDEFPGSREIFGRAHGHMDYRVGMG